MGSSDNGIEIYADTSIPLQDRQGWVQAARDYLPEHTKREWWRKIVELDLEADKEIAEVVKVVKDDLVKSYQSSGVDESSLTFPELSLVDSKKIQRPYGGIGVAGAAGGMRNRAEVFLMGGNNLLLDIKSIHHEVDHELGREIGIVNNERVLSGILLGHHLTLSKEANRGQVIEEGSVEYEATKFVLDSQSPVCIEARKKFAGEVSQKYYNGKNNEGSLNSYEIRELCKEGIDKEEPPSQKASRELIEFLINSATRLSQNDGTEMRLSLLKTRIKTKNMRILMDKVDSLFGEGTLNKIRNLNFDNAEEIIKFRESLR